MGHLSPTDPDIACFLEKSATPARLHDPWELSGWIFGRGDTRCCAVRTRADDQAVNGIHGVPRPDVAANFPGEPQAGFSGFRCTFPPSQSVALEWLDPAGQWHEFWRGRNPTVLPSRRIDPPTLPVRLVPSLADTLREKVAGLSWPAAWRETHRLLANYAASPAPSPLTGGLQLHLDQPVELAPAGRLLPIAGWIFHPGRPIRHVFARAEPDGMAHLVFPQSRRDVARIHTELGAPEACGFTGTLLLPEGVGSFWLRLYAEYRDGTVVLAATRQCFRAAKQAEAGQDARALLLLGATAIAGKWRPESWWRAWQQLRKSRAPEQPASVTTGVLKLTAPPMAADAVTAPQVDAAQHGDPLISLIVPVFNPSERHLREMIASVQGQSYGRWELCLADDASTAPHVRPVLEEFARADPRVRVVFRSTNGHIARASNTALTLARGRFVALLDHDDLLPTDALLPVVEAMRSNPGARFFYTNRDKVDDQGRHFDPENRGAWNPAAATTHNYLHHLTVICREVVARAGAFRAEYFGSQDLDLYLRCHELLAPDEIVHVPVIGYHWRAHPGSTASRGDQKDYMFDSARRAIVDALQRRGLRAQPFLPDFGPIFGMNLHQLRWDPAVLREQKLSVVVAVTTTNRAQLPLCLADLRATCAAEEVQIIVVAARESVFVADRQHVEIHAAPAGADLASLYNLGARHARHPTLLLLDAAARPDTTDWLEDLAGWLGVPGVAAVGPKLVAHDGRLASAAWTIGHDSGLPEPVGAGAPLGELVSPFLAHASRDALLLDARCLLTRTDLFRELGGYDSARFPERYFAADFCLRLRDRNQRVVFTPQAVLSVAPTEISATDAIEAAAFRLRHHGRSDPWILPQPEESDLSERMRAGPFRNDWMPANTIAFRDGWFFLERPYPGEKIHAGHQVLNGWCIGRAGQAPSDLRVRAGDRIYFAEVGFPRPDLAALVGRRGELYPAGFTVELDLAPGPVRLEFEACLDDRQWQPVAIVEFTIDRGSVPTQPDDKLVVSPEHFEHLIDLPLRHAADGPLPELARLASQLAEDTGCFRRKRHARAPFHGFIDNPMPVFVPFYGEIGVIGWVFHERQAIRRVAVSFDSHSWQEVALGQPSPKIGARYPGLADAAQCGFHGNVTVPQNLPQPLQLRVWAELEDGTWHLVFALRCRAHPPSAVDASALHGASTAALVTATTAFRTACMRQGIAAPGLVTLASMLRTLRRKWPAPASRPRETPSVRPTPAPARPHLLLVTHNLNREGAPLFLLEFAAYCREQLAANISIVSPFDGPLRVEFQKLGVAVRLVDRTALWSAQTAGAARDALDRLDGELRAENATVVVANTVESFWAIPAAQRAGRPALFYIHEPGILGLHYLQHLPVEVRRAAAATLAAAPLVSFLNRATQSYYLGFSAGRNYRIQPGWTRLTPAAELPSPAARQAGRKRLGFASDERIVINVGTLCPRKGQLFEVQAIERLWRTQPELAARCRFLMIGVHDSAYGDAVAAQIARLGRPNITLVPATSRVREYFAAADLFVLTSFEEGFSRVLLEAMDFGLPIVCPAIHGIPEIVRHEQEALLVPPADSPALADAMQRLLHDERLASALGLSARARLESTFTTARVQPGHLATLLSLAPELRAVQHSPRSVAPVGLTGS